MVARGAGAARSRSPSICRVDGWSGGGSIVCLRGGGGVSQAERPRVSGGPSSPLRDYASCRCSPAASSMSARCSGSRFPTAIATAHSLPPTPPPALDWWRGFRSRELTALIEEAQTANFDIAAAVAKIIQADAQSKIAGAPLLPAADFDASVDALAAGRAGPTAPPGAPRSPPATRSISGARTARSRAPRRRARSPRASTATRS